jgi:phenylacetate-coenzyme A ligase PaaK-like adenylate-forming protein
MHLAEDLLIVEPVDDNGGAVKVGDTSAKIYLTNLINQALPLIRYEITDQVRVLPEACACGSAFARVDDIQGRVENIFRYRDGVSVYPHVFGSQLSRQQQIIEYQVLQTPNGADVLVRANDEIDLGALGARIATHVEKAGLVDPTIAVRRVQVIERTRAGKLKRYVPL